MTDLVLLFALLAVGAAGEAPLAEAEMGARFCPRPSGVFPGPSMPRSMWSEQVGGVPMHREVWRTDARYW